MVRTMVEVDLFDLKDEDIKREAILRGFALDKNTPLESIIDVLEEKGFPDYILDQLLYWNNQPELNQEKLNKWIDFCGLKPYEFNKEVLIRKLTGID